MKPKKIVSFGEIVWDVFGDKSTLGGAPLNFAYYCIKNGCDARIISAIGRDSLGQSTLAEMKRLSIPSDFVGILDGYPTGRVNVSIDAKGLANYEICSPSAWDFIEASPQACEFLRGADAFVFGSLAQRSEFSRATLNSIMGLLPDTCLKVFDVNLRQNFYTKDILEKSMRFANILKLNDEELALISKIFGISGGEKDMAGSMFELFNLDYLVLTLGARGHLIVSKGGVLERAAEPVNLVDTVGAGDSFTATFLSFILDSKSLREASDAAAKMAARVCSQKGALID